jgi:UDP-3-O-[3-hydroxymyristoyl] glucosamine N-acyltransferase
MKLKDIAAQLNTRVEGDGEVEILRVAKIEEATEGAITFLANPRYEKFLPTTRASAVIVGHALQAPPKEPGRTSLSLLRVDDPYLAFLQVMVRFQPPGEPVEMGIHPTAVLHPSARLGEGVRIGAHAVIGADCRIGSNAVVGHNTVLESGVTLGESTTVYHNVTIREGCRIGARVIIHPGATIGSDGFGFAPKPDGTFEKIPQLGIVVIEDDVEIGAGCTVDRATMGETRIEKGAKLDNLIQVAHNVVIGEHTVIAAQTGISGSSRVGRHVMIGGQTGIAGHLRIADKTRIGAKSGIHRSVTEVGQTIFGYPALPQREAFRIQGALTQLPELLTTIRHLKETVERMESRLQQLASDTTKHNEQS